MHPILCKIGPITIYSYGFMMAAAFSIAIFFAMKKAKSKAIQPNMIFDFGVILIIFGIIGARLFYIILNLGYFKKYPFEIFMISHGGLVWYGGFLGSLISGLVYLKIKKANIAQILDMFVPYVALGQAIGRIGCFLNGCCYGQKTNLFIGIDINNAVRYPTQLFESIGLLIIFLFLSDMGQRRQKFSGQVFLSYLIFYSFLRFFVEYYRADNPEVIAGLTISQIISIVLFFTASSVLFIKILRCNRT